MQPLASLLSLHIIIGSSLREMTMFPHKLLDPELEKVSVDYYWKYCY